MISYIMIEIHDIFMKVKAHLYKKTNIIMFYSDQYVYSILYQCNNIINYI